MSKRFSILLIVLVIVSGLIGGALQGIEPGLRTVEEYDLDTRCWLSTSVVTGKIYAIGGLSGFSLGPVGWRSMGQQQQDNHPLILRPGLHLFIDDHLIDPACQNTTERRLQHPIRHPASPVVPSSEGFAVCQPYVTVLLGDNCRFRMW